MIRWWSQATLVIRLAAGVAAALMVALVSIVAMSPSQTPALRDIPPVPLARAAAPPTTSTVPLPKAAPTAAVVIQQPTRPAVPTPPALTVDPATALRSHPHVVSASNGDLASISKTVPPPANYSVARVDIWGAGIRWGLVQYTGASVRQYAFVELTGSGWHVMQKGDMQSMCQVALPSEAVAAIAGLLPSCAAS